MTVSLARSGWIPSLTGFAVALAVAGAAPAPVWAQTSLESGGAATGAPRPLAPPTALMPGAEGPATAEEARPAALAPTARTLPSSLTRGMEGEGSGLMGIEINPLGDIDPDAIGTLDARNGGFGGDMWSRSDRTAVERLLRRLPSRLESATLRGLARRLLLTNAEPPRSRRATTEATATLLATRVDRLAALGDVRGLNELLRLVPQRYENDRIARARTEGLLLTGEVEEACRKVRREVARDGAAGYWRRAMVYCQLRSGEFDQAMLGVGLMVEQGSTEDDPAFFTLVDAFAGAETASVTVDSPLHLAMLHMIDRPLPDDLIEAASPGLLVAIAASERSDLEPRTRAAERAVSMGVLRTAALREIYDLYVFDSAELDDPIAALDENPGGPGRALLYQAVREREQPTARAQLIQAALERAAHPAVYQLLVRVLLPDLLEVPVEPPLLWFADPAGRALFAAGRLDEGAAWYLLARQEALLDPQGAAAAASLWPYYRLAGNPTLPWQGDMEAWQASREDESSAELARQAWLRGALKALGEDEGEAVSWLDLATLSSEAPPPDGALLFALRDASDMGRVGETVLLSILIIGEKGPADCHPTALVAALSALRGVGLEREARALAIEAAVAKGI